MTHQEILLKLSQTFGNARIILTATSSSVGTMLHHFIEVKGKLDSSWRPVGSITWVMGAPKLNESPRAETGDIRRVREALSPQPPPPPTGNRPATPPIPPRDRAVS